MSSQFIEVNHLLGGRYKITDVLSNGSMGAVYVAEDTKLLNKRWVIKEMTATPWMRNGIDSEAETLIGLRHPNLPNIVDYLPSDHSQSGYLVMDYVEGETLLDRFIRCGNRLPLEWIISYAIQLCEVLHYLHQQPDPIIHRDLKPANLMIDEHERIILIDFGTARRYKEGMTNDTVQIGTIGFAAPEQFNHTQTDCRTDLYSLGAILYYLLSDGQYYYLMGIPLADKTKIQQLPIHLFAIIEKLLSHHPEDRYASAIEVQLELQRVKHSMLNDQFKQIHNNKSSKNPDKKLIVLLSLYPGAGCTFTSMGLAGQLRRYKIEHALVEHPANEPELFQRCNGYREAPEEYSFPLEQVLNAHKLQKELAWCIGSTTLYPLDPVRIIEEWNTEKQLRLLFEIPESIILVDLSHHWDDVMVQDMIRQADEVLVVAGPNRTRLESSRIVERIEMIKGWFNYGKRVSMIANHWTSFSYGAYWLDMLKPLNVYRIPELDLFHVLNYEWIGGTNAWETYLFKEEYNTMYDQILKSILPELDWKFYEGKQLSKKKLFNNVFKRLLNK
ncbi:MAG: serine/threonine-protein kinase [Paenibacillaceae bacterium]